MYIALYLLAAAAIQWVAGGFPAAAMAFPLNAIVGTGWFFMLWWLWKKEDLRWIRALGSPRMTVVSLGLLMGGCLITGLFPQLPAGEAAQRTGVFARLGCHDFTHSWIFIAVLWLLLSHLALVIFRVCSRRTGAGRIRFALNHGGLWLALFAGFMGSADTTVWNVPLHRGTATQKAYDEGGYERHTDYALELDTFVVERYANGVPEGFTAKVSIGKDREQATLRVNHPYAYSWDEDIYLSGYEDGRWPEGSYCVVQVVKQPWKYGVAAGICLMLAGAVLLFFKGVKHDDQLG